MSKAYDDGVSDAIRHRIDRLVVGLVVDEQGKAPTNWGSATLLRARSGAVVCLTAWHVVEERRSLRVLSVHGDFPDAVEGVIPGPENKKSPEPLDVAIAVLKPEASKVFEPDCMSISALPNRAETQALIDRNPVIVAGLPKQLASRVDNQVYMSTLIMRARNAKLGDGIISVQFRRGLARGDLSHPGKQIFADGQWANLKKPEGISGGPIFGLAPRTVSKVWPQRTRSDLLPSHTNSRMGGRWASLPTVSGIGSLSTWQDCSSRTPEED